MLAFLDANFKVLAAQPAYARLLEQEVDIVRVFLNNFKPDAAPRFFRQITPLLTEFRAVLEEGVKTGVFRKIDIDAVLPLLLMLVRTAVQRDSNGREITFPLPGKYRPKGGGRQRSTLSLALFLRLQDNERGAGQPGSSQ